MGGYNPRNIRRMTPEVTGLPSLLPLLMALNRQRIITSKFKMCSRSSNVSVLIKKGCFLLEKVSVFLKFKGACLA